MLKQAHVYIKGDVIGVGFRAWTKIQAKTLNVSGWVRNTYDRSDLFGPGGGIEAVFQADQSKLSSIVEVVRKGSPVSRVDDVEIIYQEPKEIFEDFQIRK